MLAKPVVTGFVAGIGAAVLVGMLFWAASPNPAVPPVEMNTVAEASGATTAEIATLDTDRPGAAMNAAIAAEPGAIAVDETELIVEDTAPIEDEPASSSAPAASARASAPAPAPRPSPRPTPPPPAEPVEREPVEPREAEPVEWEEPELERESEPDWAEEDGVEDMDPDYRTDETEPVDRPVSAAVIDDMPARQPRRPPAPIFEELILSADSVISLQVDTPVTTETAVIEDRVEARTLRDVKVGSETAIPAGSIARGSVTLVESGGKFKERARLGIRFHTIVLTDGTEVPLQTETIYREGSSVGRESAAKIGGAAAAGAILGAIFGGKKGAAIGGAAGAGAGTAATAAGGRNPAELPAGTPVTIRLLQPATVTVER